MKTEDILSSCIFADWIFVYPKISYHNLNHLYFHTKTTISTPK